MRKADLITGIVLLVLSGYVIRESWQMPQSATFGPGVGFLPFWLGVLLAALAVILIAGAWRRPKDPQGRSPFPARKALITVGSVLAGLALYIVLVDVLGFLAATFLFVAYLLGAVERERWTVTVSIALLTTAGLYIIFHMLLGIALPRNMFGF